MLPRIFFGSPWQAGHLEEAGPPGPPGLLQPSLVAPVVMGLVFPESKWSGSESHWTTLGVIYGCVFSNGEPLISRNAACHICFLWLLNGHKYSIDQIEELSLPWNSDIMWYIYIYVYPTGSMVLLYMVTWIPSIYPLYVSIYTSTMDPSWVYIIGSPVHSFSICSALKFPVVFYSPKATAATAATAVVKCRLGVSQARDETGVITNGGFFHFTNHEQKCT